MSATYRQAAVVSADALERDRDNHLLSRGPRYRMDAEMLRDYALASSDLLVPHDVRPGVKPYQPEDIWSIVGLPGGNTRNYVQDTGDNLYRRSLYTFWKRMAPPPNMEAFNAPSREVWHHPPRTDQYPLAGAGHAERSPIHRGGPKRGATWSASGFSRTVHLA
ncbi:MAG: DUF1553 domain-containing protein [Planctomycetaceae bacterium]